MAAALARGYAAASNDTSLYPKSINWLEFSALVS
jgi:hypothetical protein